LPVELSSTVCRASGADSTRITSCHSERGSTELTEVSEESTSQLRRSFRRLGSLRMTKSGSRWFVVVLALGALAGCGERGPKMHQVSGHVFYKDGSVPTGGVCLVGLEPAENSTAKIRKGATGVIGPDGAFELITRKPGDGVHDGEYAVRFVVRKNGLDPATSLIPQKYESGTTSGIEHIVVDRDISDLKFELEPLKGAPKK